MRQGPHLPHATTMPAVFSACTRVRQDDEASEGDAEPTEPPPSAPPPAPAGAPPPAPPPLDPLRGIASADFARFDGELDSEMGRQFEVLCPLIQPQTWTDSSLQALNMTYVTGSRKIYFPVSVAEAHSQPDLGLLAI